VPLGLVQGPIVLVDVQRDYGVTCTQGMVPGKQVEVGLTLPVVPIGKVIVAVARPMVESESGSMCLDFLGWSGERRGFVVSRAANQTLARSAFALHAAQEP
jgi:hypothetical protein